MGYRYLFFLIIFFCFTAPLSSNAQCTASVNITASQTTFCTGNNITFTATPTNGGPAPVYQWQVNGINAGTNSDVFSSSTLADNDVITVIMISNAVCVSVPVVFSNSIQVTEAAFVTPSVSIAVTGGSQVSCAGSSVTFTATPVNGGTAPDYQWQVNGVNAGTNSNVFTSATLADNDVVTVILTSNAGCLATNNVTGNSITMTVNPSLTPSVGAAITAGSSTICAGAPVTFTASPTNGGPAPVYQWQINGINVGSNSSTYTSNTLTNGDAVTVIMTSNATCLNGNNPTSSPITMAVYPIVTPSVTISTPQTSVCAGSFVTFTATTTNEGSAPVYQWQVNGINTGTNSTTFTTNTLANNDVISFILTNTDPCTLSSTATSNNIQVSVSPSVTPSVSIAITAGNQTICTGASVTFTASPVNGGAAPTYQWQINGVNTGTNSSTFTSTTLSNGDIITVNMTSNAGCAVPALATSNSIQMTVNSVAAPSVSISASQTSICAGAAVLFTATPVNGGPTPVYQWQVNGVNAGTNSPAFSTNTLTNGNTVRVIMTSSLPCAVPPSVMSNTITMTVNPIITPSVNIAITSGSQTSCQGGPVTFTATPVNPGPTPSYQWRVNGVNVGTNSPTYTTGTLLNGDQVRVRLTSSAICGMPVNTSSNTITMIVNNNLVPSVSITASSTNICQGAQVTFTATPVNGGSAPSYQWKINGLTGGTNSPTYITTALSNNDVVKVIMTSNEQCLVSNNPSSNSITMTVNQNLTPSVSINATATTICAGTSVTFNATPTHGGATPAYQWKINGVNAGTNSPSFTTNTLANGDVVKVVLTSSATCLTSNNPISNGITMTVNPNLVPSVNITASSSVICAGGSATFTATPANGGTSPVYQWQVNGINAGTNSNTFTTNTLANGDAVTVIMTSNESCLASNNPTSNNISMTVNPNLTPSVSIAATATTICAGTPVTFTATPTNGGTSPSYQWKVNGVNAGTNSNTFTTSSLANGDIITVVITSNAACLATATGTSNALTMTVNPNLVPAVSIAVTGGASTICAGSPVTFTATPTNGGTNPNYQWQVNGLNAGTNNASFTSAALTNGAAVTVILTSNETCLASNNPMSNPVTITVNDNLTPSVTISTASTAICRGSNALFTATPVNGGSAPIYLWKVNGVNAGGNSPVFSYASFSTGDVVTAVMNSDITCLTTNNIASNALVMTVADIPVVTLTADNDEILPGGSTQLHTASTQPIGAYSWSPSFSLNEAGSSQPIASPGSTTPYELEATSEAGCKAIARITIKVVKGPEIANTFTPNNDGIHDKWEIKNLETYPDCRVQVFTRLGQQVFESRGYKTPWNGTYKNKPLPIDTYYYVIELNNRIGSKPVTGYVTILK